MRTRPLEGGVSAITNVLDIENQNGNREQLVLKRLGLGNFCDEWDLPSLEYFSLGYLQDLNFSVPEPVLYEEPGVYFDEPVLLMSFIENDRSEPEDVSRKMALMARELTTLHATTSGLEKPSFLPRLCEIEEARITREVVDPLERYGETAIRETLRANWPMAKRNADAFLHGDYWPENILWRNGEIAAIVDWEGAAFGDPVADLAVARLEILWMHGDDATEEFTEQYRAVSGADLTDLPLHDLLAALMPIRWFSSWAESEEERQSMRDGHRRLTSRAIERLRRSR